MRLGTLALVRSKARGPVQRLHRLASCEPRAARRLDDPLWPCNGASSSIPSTRRERSQRIAALAYVAAGADVLDSDRNVRQDLLRHLRSVLAALDALHELTHVERGFGCRVQPPRNFAVGPEAALEPAGLSEGTGNSVKRAVNDDAPHGRARRRLRRVVAMAEQLPRCRESLDRFARRH